MIIKSPTISNMKHYWELWSISGKIVGWLSEDLCSVLWLGLYSSIIVLFYFQIRVFEKLMKRMSNYSLLIGFEYLSI